MTAATTAQTECEFSVWKRLIEHMSYSEIYEKTVRFLGKTKWKMNLFYNY